MDRLQFGDARWRTIARPVLYRMDPERAHHVALRLLAGMPLILVRTFWQSPLADDKAMRVEVGGLTLRNPVGLAAGFDKDARAVAAFDALGFGCITIGTVTPKPQPGNPRPRIFRYQDKDTGALTLVNRMGFPSDGADVVAGRLRRTFSRYPINASIVVSIGANKDTVADTNRPHYVQEVVNDYLSVVRRFAPVLRYNYTGGRAKDGIEINISSPNTPGLRDLFEALPEFLARFREGITNIMHGRIPPVYLKLSPDLDKNQLEKTIDAANKNGVGALVAFNTTTNPDIRTSSNITEEGGISGAVYSYPAWLKMQELRGIVSDKAISLDIVGVGGIRDKANALTKRTPAVEIYTGLIERGPFLIHEILAAFKNRHV